MLGRLHGGGRLRGTSDKAEIGWRGGEQRLVRTGTSLSTDTHHGRGPEDSEGVSRATRWAAAKTPLVGEMRSRVGTWPPQATGATGLPHLLCARGLGSWVPSSPGFCSHSDTGDVCQ